MEDVVNNSTEAVSTCHLLDLSTELRLYIYELVLNIQRPTVIKPRKQRALCARLPLGLTMANREISADSLSTYYGHPILEFDFVQHSLIKKVDYDSGMARRCTMNWIDIPASHFMYPRHIRVNVCIHRESYYLLDRELESNKYILAVHGEVGEPPRNVWDECVIGDARHMKAARKVLDDMSELTKSDVGELVRISQ